MLQGAIDENVDLLSDRPLGTTRRDRDRKRQRIKRWIFGSSMVCAALVASAGFMSRKPAADPMAADDASRLLQAGARTSLHTLPTSEQPADFEPMTADALSPATIPLGVDHIVIDAGHGGRDSGTSLQFGLLEKDLTLDVARRLGALLQSVGMQTTLTRTDDTEISLADRAAFANAARADLFVSIHVNWLPDRSARGFETYYLGRSDDPFLSALASKENRDSGFTVADTRRLLDGIFADVRRTESRRLAQSVQRALFEALRHQNDRAHSRGVMSAPFVVLVATEMPAILAEVACLSNEGEARLLAVPSYRQHIARGLAAGIIDYAHIVGGAPPDQGDQG